MASDVSDVEVRRDDAPTALLPEWLVREQERAIKKAQAMVWLGRVAGSFGIAAEEAQAAGLTREQAHHRLDFELDVLGVPEGEDDAV